MKFSWSPHSPLNGAAVFLSASVPDPRRDRRFLAGPVDELLMLRLIDQRVFDAVQSLVAQVLAAGGRLVHGGHPTITHAIAAQAGNWRVEPGIEPPILLYQSQHFRSFPPPPGRQEMEEAGFAAVRWTPPTLEGCDSRLQPAWLKDWLPAQAPSTAPPALHEALLAMRLQMLLETQPRLAICLGGMEGIKAEADLWFDLCQHGLLHGQQRIAAVVSTFGATEQLDEARALRVIGSDDSSPAEPGDTDSPAELTDDLFEPVSYDGLMRDLVAGIQP